jgi:hypothetical protein
MRVAGTGLILLASAATGSTEYIWPSKYDFLEDLLSLQSGYFRKGFIDRPFPRPYPGCVFQLIFPK